MTKVVINARHGGFSLSRAAFLKLRELGNEDALNEPDVGEMYPDGSGPRARSPGSLEMYLFNISRTDPQLIAVVEEMGDAANGACSQLSVVEIPNDVEWQIEEYHGWEWVAEKHRTWS